MTRIFFIWALFAALSAAAQTPEEMYGEYITPETQAVLDRFEEAERQAQEAEAAARSRKMLALSVSVLIGLIPVGATGWRIIREKTWTDSPSGAVKSIAVSLVGGAVLAALNYGVFLLKMSLGDAFHTGLAFLMVAALIAGSFYLIKH